MTIPMAVIIAATMLARICKALFEILDMVPVMLSDTINGAAEMQPQTRAATAVKKECCS